MPPVARVARVVASCALTRLPSVALGAIRRFAQAVALVPRDQPIDHRVEIPRLDELGQLEFLEAVPWAGDRSFGMVIGPHFFPPSPGPTVRRTTSPQGS